MRQQLKRMGFLSALGLLAVGTVARAAPQSVPLAAPRNLVLVGVTQVGDRSQAWLMDVDSRTKETVAPGGTAFGFRVKSVGPERVVLTRGGRDYALRLGERQVPTIASVPVRAAAPTISGRIALPRSGTLPNVFAPPVFLTQETDPGIDTRTAPPATTTARDLFTDPSGRSQPDPRLLPDIYPGYGAMAGYGMLPGYGVIPGYEMAPGYGAIPGYGFDPQAAGYPAYPTYPTYPSEAAGYPGALFASPGAVPGYPGYFGSDAYYPSGMLPYTSATAWGSPYAGQPPFAGNGLDLSAPRWSRQSGRRQNVDPFRGEITVNPQTQRRRARFAFPVQGQ
jgi:hypothetical protein